MPAEVRLGLVRAGYRRVALRPPGAPVWFGQLREAAAPAPGRVVVETWSIDSQQPVCRVSRSCGEARRLARILVRLVDDLTFVERAA